jgi:heat shock protein HtpX
LDPNKLLHHKFMNWLQSIAILGGMGGLLAAVGWLLGGIELMIWAVVAGALLLLLAPRVSPRLILRVYGAREIGPYGAPELLQLIVELSRRAGLAHVPRLYYVPSQVLNAFTVGRHDEAAVALSDGLLRQLTLRELAGVIAHELSHVRNNDIWVMDLADLVGRLTSVLSLFGQLLLIFSLPLVALTDANVPWLAILLLVFAPALSSLLQLALSRTREFDADLHAAALTGDPYGLASALVKLERQPVGLTGRFFLPRRRDPVPSVLRTHPHTAKRVERLLSLVKEQPAAYPWRLADRPLHLPHQHPRVGRLPRHHFTGLWH